MTYLGTQKTDGTITRLDHLGIRLINPGTLDYINGYRYSRDGKKYKTLELSKA